MDGALTAVPLLDLPPRAIEPLVAEQIEEWRTRLLWDYTRVAERLLFLSDLRALAGLALFNGAGQMIGYATCDFGPASAEFSDFYVSPASRSPEVNTALALHCYPYLAAIPRVSLAPAVPHLLEVEALPTAPRVSTSAAEAASVERICSRLQPNRSDAIELRPWQEGDEEAAAEIMPESFTRESHGFTEDYAPVAARDYIATIIHTQPTFPFLPEASVTAIHRQSGKLCGFLLANHAMDGVAYANFLCVAPWVALHHLGDRLSIAHCLALSCLGYHTVTLRRRTTDPRLARFYARMGFVKQFDLVSYEWI